jgi:L-asparaginase
MIQIITTGGTIAKRYDEISGELVFDENHLEKILDQSRVEVDLTIKSLFLKDSLEMDEDDREIILDAVKSTSFKNIIITHGTDTMIESAKKLSTIKDKTIILTGAMIPFSFKNSDALFNVGSAFGAIEVLRNGVYVVMNGKVFDFDKVKKDKKLGKFVTID